MNQNQAIAEQYTSAAALAAAIASPFIYMRFHQNAAEATPQDDTVTDLGGRMSRVIKRGTSDSNALGADFDTLGWFQPDTEPSVDGGRHIHIKTSDPEWADVREVFRCDIGEYLMILTGLKVDDIATGFNDNAFWAIGEPTNNSDVGGIILRLEASGGNKLQVRTSGGGGSSSVQTNTMPVGGAGQINAGKPHSVAVLIDIAANTSTLRVDNNAQAEVDATLVDPADEPLALDSSALAAGSSFGFLMFNRQLTDDGTGYDNDTLSMDSNMAVRDFLAVKFATKPSDAVIDAICAEHAANLGVLPRALAGQ